MLWAIAVVLLVLWVLGFVAFHVTTGFIHLLLLVALVVVAIQLLSGRRGAI
ncbi:MAG TPA: lmo0937 family membrane protein [Polyangiaceae bacterium]|nr:lmo0937 family membrane protein [Polyangiaceae bacterium]